MIILLRTDLATTGILCCSVKLVIVFSVSTSILSSSSILTVGLAVTEAENYPRMIM